MTKRMKSKHVNHVDGISLKWRIRRPVWTPRHWHRSIALCQSIHSHSTPSKHVNEKRRRTNYYNNKEEKKRDSKFVCCCRRLSSSSHFFPLRLSYGIAGNRDAVELDVLTLCLFIQKIRFVMTMYAIVYAISRH